MAPNGVTSHCFFIALHSGEKKGPVTVRSPLEEAVQLPHLLSLSPGGDVLLIFCVVRWDTCAKHPRYRPKAAVRAAESPPSCACLSHKLDRRLSYSAPFLPHRMVCTLGSLHLPLAGSSENGEVDFCGWPKWGNRNYIYPSLLKQL